MNTFTTEPLVDSCIIWLHRPNTMREIHSQVFRMFNPKFVEDANVMRDALNRASRERDAVKNCATIAEQVN